MFSSRYDQKQGHPNFIDLQYEICSQFMKMTSDQLRQKELDLLLGSSKLIEKVNEGLTNKDISTTQDSLDSPNDEDDNFQDNKGRLTLSRSRSNGTLRRSQTGITEALLEVQRNCSEKTVAVISGVVAQGRKSREKALCFDRLYLIEYTDSVNSRRVNPNIKQSMLNTSCTTLQPSSKKKISDLELTNCNLETEFSKIKAQIKETKVQLGSEIRGSRADHQKNESSADQGEKLKKYLEDRELQIVRKEKDLKSIQCKIQSSLSLPLESECDKCCQLIRRIKDSVVTYRKFLEEEANLAEELYHNYKSLFF